MKKKKVRILPGLTTTHGSDWREKIKEIKKFGIREVALFPTILNEAERRELYLALEKIPRLKVAHVHLRNDMKVWELDYLVDRFGTEVFNTHSAREYRPQHDLSKYADRIFLENSLLVPTRGELIHFAGLCIDFSHWENGIRVEKSEYLDFPQKVLDFPAGCGHISSIKHNIASDHDRLRGEHWTFECHRMRNLDELNYIRKYLEHIPPILSIELANPFREQLKAKEYLEKIVNG